MPRNCRVSTDELNHDIDQSQRTKEWEMGEEERNEKVQRELRTLIMDIDPIFREAMAGEGLSKDREILLAMEVTSAVSFRSTGAYERLGRAIAKQVEDYMLPIIRDQID